jgi:hypothetical protein
MAFFAVVYLLSSFTTAGNKEVQAEAKSKQKHFDDLGLSR